MRAPHLAPAVCPSSATDLSPACAECVGSDWVNVNQDFPVEERELSNVKFARAASRVYEELCPGGKGALACRALGLRAKPESGSLKCPMSPLHAGVEGLLGGKSHGLFSRALLADMELVLRLLLSLACLPFLPVNGDSRGSAKLRGKLEYTGSNCLPFALGGALHEPPPSPGAVVRIP